MHELLWFVQMPAAVKQFTLCVSIRVTNFMTECIEEQWHRQCCSQCLILSLIGEVNAVVMQFTLWQVSLVCQTGAAEDADVVLFFAGITMLNERECRTTDQAPAWVPFLEGEGLDRHHLDLPASQNDTLQVRRFSL